LPPMSRFPPPPPPPPGPGGRRDFLIGLGIGLIPLLMAMVGLGGVIFSARVGNYDTTVYSILLGAGAVLYIVELITMALFASSPRLRRVGFGLLTMVAASPVVFAIGCVAILVAPQ